MFNKFFFLWLILLALSVLDMGANAHADEKNTTRFLGALDLSEERVGAVIAPHQEIILTFQSDHRPAYIKINQLTGKAHIVIESEKKELIQAGQDYVIQKPGAQESIRIIGGEIDGIYDISLTQSIPETYFKARNYKVYAVWVIVALILIVFVLKYAQKIGRKQAVINLTMVTISILLALGLCEILLRLVPTPLTAYSEHLKIVPEPDFGYIYAPNANFFYERSPCIKINNITTNSEGFRDSEWGKDAQGVIAILGDSVMAALEVSQGANTADIMETLLKQPVLNFGMSGLGPVAELELYRKYVKRHKPRIVLQYILLTNDISDSNAAMTYWESGKLFQATGYAAHGELKTIPPQDLPHFFEVNKTDMATSLLRHCYLCRALSKATDIFPKFLPAHATELPKASNYPAELKNYIESESKKLDQFYGADHQEYKYDAHQALQKPEVWKDAWGSAEKAIANLAHEVQQDGGIYILVPVPITEWDAAKGMQRLQKFADKNHFLMLNATPVFEREKLKYEGGLAHQRIFAFSCDGHWNPHGHMLMATETIRFLIAHGLLADTKQNANLLVRLDQLQKTSAKEILGTEAYEQIYVHKGAYTGVSKVGSLLKP